MPALLHHLGFLTCELDSLAGCGGNVDLDFERSRKACRHFHARVGSDGEFFARIIPRELDPLGGGVGVGEVGLGVAIIIVEGERAIRAGVDVKGGG